MILSLPNILTYTRILSVPAIALFLYNTSEPSDSVHLYRWIALVIFIVAGITDFLDGWMARLWSLQSALGRMLDPIADKLLVATILIMLVHNQTITSLNVTAAVIILCREILVSGLREYLAATAISLPVTQLAKWKTAAQMLSLGFLIISDTGQEIFFFCHETGLVCLWIAALLTIYTGYDYLKSGITRAIAEDNKKAS